MEKIKYAIFDVGQTIYPFNLKALSNFMQKESSYPELFADNSPVFAYDYNPYMIGQIDNNQFIKELCENCHVPYSKKTAIEINKALHLGCGKPFDETIKAMHQLQLADVELAILSNALPLLHDTKIDLVKPEFAFTSYNLGLLKPDVEIYKAVAQKLNTPYKQLLFIDDKEKNVAAAKTLGIKGIVYNRKTILQEINTFLPQKPINFCHSR